MITSNHRREFEQLTAFGIRRLVQANMYDDEKLKRAVRWLHEQERGWETQEVNEPFGYPDDSLRRP